MTFGYRQLILKAKYNIENTLLKYFFERYFFQNRIFDMSNIRAQQTAVFYKTFMSRLTSGSRWGALTAADL